MNKYRIENPNNNKVRDCKSRTTESKTKIQIKISQETITSKDAKGNTEYTFGVMNPKNSTIDLKGNVKLREAEITIYEGTIKQYLNDYNPDDIVSRFNSPFGKISDTEKIIGAVGAHEAEHTTPENLKQSNLEEEGIIPKGYKEVEPNKKGNQVIRELENNQ